MDITVPAPQAAGTVVGACMRAGVAASVGEAEKRDTYADLEREHDLVPFVVEWSGGLGDEAMAFMRRVRERCKRAELVGYDEQLATFAVSGFMDYYLQKISVELLRGQGQFYSKVAEQCMDKQGFGAPVVEVGAPASGSSQGRGSGSAHRRGRKRDRDELEMGVGV